MKQIRKKNKGVRKIAVAYPELVTKHILKKRRSNPRANITLSGKKRNKLLKQLRIEQSEKSRMDTAEEIGGKRAKKLRKKGPNAGSTIQDNSQHDDVEMEESND